MQQDQNMFVLEVELEKFKDSLEKIRNKFKKNESSRELFKELIEISIDLQSYLLRWNLQKPGNKIISDKEIINEVKKNYSLLKEFGYSKEVDEIKKEVARIKSCNMYNLSIITDEGKINNRWGNNDGTGLKYAMRRGAVLVTTNPKIINVLRKKFPEYWNKKKEDVKRKYKPYTSEQIAARVTTEVVLESARLLRPVYKFGEKNIGYVSLQLNPHLSKNSKAMVEEAMMIYSWLKDAFNGEEPNVVFKVPGTFAGLDTTRELTSKGIGVNITVNYSVAQQLAFGEIIEKGNAKHCYLTQMNRRLEAPVAEELGEGECDNQEKISSWSSSAVIRMAYNILYKKRGYRKSVLLGASISKPWHVQRTITGGSDHSLHMTISPEELDAFDRKLGEFYPCMSKEIEKEKIKRLLQSETFRKAYEVDGLKLKEFDNFKPTLTTLNGFKEEYNEFLRWCVE